MSSKKFVASLTDDARVVIYDRQMFISTEACPSVEHLKSASIRQAPALLLNIRLGWKGLPETNGIANYEDQ